jgi:hypothetical protein
VGGEAEALRVMKNVVLREGGVGGKGADAGRP